MLYLFYFFLNSKAVNAYYIKIKKSEMHNLENDDNTHLTLATNNPEVSTIMLIS